MLPTMSLAYASCERFYELGICFGGRLLPCIGRLKGESEGGLKGGLIGGLKGSSVLGAAVGDAADGQSAVEAVLQVPCGPHCLPQRFLLAKNIASDFRQRARSHVNRQTCTLNDSQLYCPGPHRTPKQTETATAGSQRSIPYTPIHCSGASVRIR